MNKITDFFIEVFSSKLKNPIVVTYLISSVIYNWKPIIFLFISNESIRNKIKTIETEYTFSLLKPLIYSILFILIINFIMFIVDKTQYYPKKWRENVKGDYIIKKLEIEENIANKKATINFINNHPQDFHKFINQKNDLEHKIKLLELQIEQNKEIEKDYKFALNFIQKSTGEFNEEKENFELKKEFNVFKETYLFKTFLKISSELYVNGKTSHYLKFLNNDDKIFKLEEEKIITIEYVDDGIACFVSLTDRGYFFLKEHIFRKKTMYNNSYN